MDTALTVRHDANHFTCITFINAHSHSTEKVLSLFPFHREMEVQIKQLVKVTWLESGKVSLHTEGMGPQSLRAYFPHGDTCSRQMFVESLLWFGAIFGAKNKVNRDIAMGSLKCNV